MRVGEHSALIPYCESLITMNSKSFAAGLVVAASTFSCKVEAGF
jgi:hypothetical protein